MTSWRHRPITCWFSMKSGQYLLSRATHSASRAFSLPAADFWVASSSASLILASNISSLLLSSTASGSVSGAKLLASEVTCDWSVVRMEAYDWLKCALPRLRHSWESPRRLSHWHPHFLLLKISTVCKVFFCKSKMKYFVLSLFLRDCWDTAERLMDDTLEN